MYYCKSWNTLQWKFSYSKLSMHVISSLKQSTSFYGTLIKYSKDITFVACNMPPITMHSSYVVIANA